MERVGLDRKGKAGKERSGEESQDWKGGRRTRAEGKAAERTRVAGFEWAGKDWSGTEPQEGVGSGRRERERTGDAGLNHQH